jgi:hypothetical protein
MTAGPPGESFRLSAVSAAHFCASGPGTDVDGRGAAVAMIPLDVVDTAKLSIASDAPPKQISKARQTRRSKTPDWEPVFSFIGFLRCIPIGCATPRVKRDQQCNRLRGVFQASTRCHDSRLRCSGQRDYWARENLSSFIGTGWSCTSTHFPRNTNGTPG